MDKQLHFCKITDKKWDILKNGPNDLVVTTLRGSDGKDDHCVTIYGSWLFDSNFDYALPLTKETLDLCCSAEGSNDTFESVGEARICKFFMNVEKKKRKKKSNTKKCP